jgi:hypothetical protein
VVSLAPRPLYARGKSPRYQLDRRLGGPQSRSERRGEEKILALPGLELRPLGRSTRSQSLYRLRYPDSQVEAQSMKYYEQRNKSNNETLLRIRVMKQRNSFCCPLGIGGLLSEKWNISRPSSHPATKLNQRQAQAAI